MTEDYRLHLSNAHNTRNAGQASAILQRQNPRFIGPSNDDVVGIYANSEIERMRVMPFVYRTTRFVANSKFSNESTQSNTSITWSLSNQGNAIGSINTRIDLFDSIVGVELNPFYVPSSIFSDSDLSFNSLQVYLGAISSPDFVSYDYRGFINETVAVPYHFDCTVGSATNDMRLITPRTDRIVFSSPIALVDLTWRVAFQSPFRQLTIPPSVLSATTLIATNPMQMTVTAHGLTTGNQIVFDTGSFGQYTTGSRAYNITVVGPNTISVDDVDSRATATLAAIPTGTKITISVVQRMIRIPTNIICIDKRANGPSSVGSNLLV